MIKFIKMILLYVSLCHRFFSFLRFEWLILVFSKTDWIVLNRNIALLISSLNSLSIVLFYEGQSVFIISSLMYEFSYRGVVSIDVWLFVVDGFVGSSAIHLRSSNVVFRCGTSVGRSLVFAIIKTSRHVRIFLLHWIKFNSTTWGFGVLGFWGFGVLGFWSIYEIK